MIARSLQLLAVALTAAALAQAGCSPKSHADDPRRVQADEQCRQRWGKGIDELDELLLVAISPNNENIQNEFEWAFSLDHAVRFGQRVRIQWRDVGGGGSSIEAFLLNTYRYADSAGVDVVWGGGEFPFRKLAKAGLLEKLPLDSDTLANIPRELGGMELRDKNLLWCGSAVSGFGILNNTGMLARCELREPKTWDDLADPSLADLIALADPTQSGSAAATYLMIARSGADWHDGWAKLLRLLANARRMEDSAGAAAQAPLIGQSLSATSIDFYAAMRVAQAPDQMSYVSPAGQTAFSPDPIGILKNPPNRELARRFVQFVLSARGQALYCLRVGQVDGPVKNALARQPIRRDVYGRYAGAMSPWIVDPYAQGQAMDIDAAKKKINYDVVKKLVQAAAVDNMAGLRAARVAMAKAKFPPVMQADFVALPPDIDTADKMADVAAKLADPVAAELTVTAWGEFFREKYERIADGQ